MTDPLLVDLPDSVQTPRLLLRVPQAGDGPALHEAIVESLPELRQFLGFLPWLSSEPSPEVAEARCRTGAANFLARTDLPFLMFDRATRQLLGGIGLHRTVWATPKTEVGYWIRCSRTGEGLVSEAVQALTLYAFERMAAQRVELITDEANLASRRVAQKCEYQLEGVLRHERRAPDGSLRNTCVYARLAPA